MSKPALKFAMAFESCIEKFGFIVIGVYRGADVALFKVGAPVNEIWGSHTPPKPLIVSAKATRADWVKQNKYLITLGASFPDFALNPERGAKFFRLRVPA